MDAVVHGGVRLALVLRSPSPVRVDEDSGRAVIRRRVMFGVAIAVGLLFGALAAIVATWGME